MTVLPSDKTQDLLMEREETIICGQWVQASNEAKPHHKLGMSPGIVLPQRESKGVVSTAQCRMQHDNAMEKRKPFRSSASVDEIVHGTGEERVSDAARYGLQERVRESHHRKCHRCKLTNDVT